MAEATRGGGLYVLLLLVAVGGTGAGVYVLLTAKSRRMDRNEVNAVAALKVVSTSEADFRHNDRDGNGVMDFWTGNVRGLYTCKSPDGAPIQLIERDMATADAEADASLPYHGYFFVALDEDDSCPHPVEKVYRRISPEKPADAKLQHRSRFGFCAFPSEVGVTGRYVYIVNEFNSVYRAPASGAPPKTWPTDAQLKQFWSRVD